MGASMGDEPLVVGGEGCMDLPPGFRFYPTDEEIITHYLFPKIVNCRFTARAIGEADLNKSEPWELPSMAKMGEKELYFFCRRDRKYPTGMRTNRATEAGYWKATGKDKEIYRGKDALVGMKRTLVFYRGRAPKGSKTNWVMHEYRLESKVSYWKLPKSVADDWVVCRIFEKTTGIKRGLSSETNSNQEDGFHYMEASIFQSPMNSHDGLHDVGGGGASYGPMFHDYAFINNQMIMNPYHMNQNPCVFYPQSFTNLAFASQNRTGAITAAIECKLEGCPSQSQMGITTTVVPMSDDMDLKTMWANPIE